MNRQLLVGATLALGAAALAGCHANPNGDIAVNGKGDSRICTPFAAVTTTAAVPGAPAVAVADGSSTVDDCVHRWAYTLAGSRDPADLVGQAAVAACATAVSGWNDQVMSQGGAPIREAMSMTTGEAMNPIAAHGEFAKARALFYVVQARAGNCAPPPVEKAATKP